MRFGRRLSHSQGALNQGRYPGTSQRNFDLWLQRITNISQVGISAVTALSIYFYVLPLYQKALLEEAIARKEVELKESTQKADRLYAVLRSNSLRIFILQVGADCSGMSLEREVSRLPDSGKMSDNARKLLNFEVTKCFQIEFDDSTALKNLRKDEQDLLLQRLLDLGRELDSERLALKADLDTFPARARSDRSLLRPPDKLQQQMRDAFERQLPGRLPPEPLDHAIARTQEGQVFDFGRKVGSRVVNLIDTFGPPVWK